MFYQDRNTPRSLILIIDVLIVFASILLAYLLRFNFNIPPNELHHLPEAIAIISGIRFISFLVSKIFAGIIRYTEVQDIIRVIIVITIGTFIIGLSTILFYFKSDYYIIPRAVIIIESITTSLGLIFFRLAVKVTYNELKNNGETSENIVFFGAGESAILGKNAMMQNPTTRLRILAFFDDSKQKIGKKIDHIDIKPATELETFLHENQVSAMIIAVQNISSKRKNEITEICLANKVKVKDIPPVNQWINGELRASQIKDIKITDLLERDEIKLNTDLIRANYTNKTILVSGAAGSIGSELCRQILKFNPKKLILLDQAETPLFHLELELNALKGYDLEIIIGDIRDYQRMDKIFNHFKPEIVFHAAAYKHVPMMENNPSEAVKTNVLGTKNLADLSIKYATHKFIMISTDKAVNPTNVMGASKRIAEIYIQNIAEDCSTKFITTRFGNVLGSNGSVIPLFKKQIEERKPLTITHPEITRYFMTIPEASLLVIEAGASSNGNEIFVFDMGKSVKILDVAKKMVKLSGLELGKDIDIIYTGLRPGEKLYEELLASSENTIPTEHQKILKAKTRPIDKQKAHALIHELIDSATKKDNNSIVRIMKELNPEFKSKNSIYEQLD